MNIGLIGSLGAGQTTLLAALYNQMRTNSRFGFKLHGSRNTDIEMSKRWKSLITQQRWPNTSKEIEKHSIELIFKEEVAEQLDFYSYPAAFLISESNDAFDHLNRMDNLIILFDSQLLMEMPADYVSYIQIIRNILIGFLNRIGDKKIFITIIFTKHDLVSHLEKVDFEIATRKNLADIFELLDTHSSSPVFSTISVSSTGNLSKDTATNTSKQDDPIEQLFPYNVALPLFVFLHWYIGRHLSDEENKLWQKFDEIMNMLKGYSLRSEISNVIARRSSIRSRILKAINFMEEQKKQVARKKEMISAVSQEIDFYTQTFNHGG
jgi:hypothetical protein